MNDIFMILLGLAMLMVVVSLLSGLFFMARGGRADPKRSQTAMRFRVALQGVAVVLFLLAVLSRMA